jgi:hypothetical protein
MPFLIFFKLLKNLIKTDNFFKGAFYGFRKQKMQSTFFSSFIVQNLHSAFVTKMSSIYGISSPLKNSLQTRPEIILPINVRKLVSLSGVAKATF